MRFSANMLLLSAALVMPGTPAHSQNVELGAIVTPKAQLQLRDAPPSGFIGLKGDPIGTASPSTNYKVIDKHSISTIFGGENWLKVQSTDKTQEGWVFSGTKNEPSANVKIK